MRGGEVGLRLLGLEAGDVDAALDKPQLQDVEHLLQLKVHLRVQCHHEIRRFIARAGVFEIEPLRELAIGLVDCVGHLMASSSETTSNEGIGGQPFLSSVLSFF